MISHVTLDGVEYLLYDERAVNRTLANQMAAQIGSGAGDYDDLLGFNAWLQDDWKLGVGKKDPEAGGFLFATVDTRFDNQMALPSTMRQPTINFASVEQTGFGTGAVSDNYYGIVDTIIDPYEYESIPVGEDEDIKKLANLFRHVAGENATDRFEVLLPSKTESCAHVAVELWLCTDPHAAAFNFSAHDPDALVESATVTLRDTPGVYWYSISTLEADGEAGNDDTYYAIVVYPINGTVIIPTISTPYETQVSYDGTTWTHNVPSFLSRIDSALAANGIDIARLGSTFPVINYIATNSTTFYAFDDLASSGSSAASGAVTGTITDLLALDGRLYIGQGDSTNYSYIDTAGSVTESNAAVPGRLFLLHNGLLYRAVGSSVFYTNDEVTWTEIEVGLDTRETVRGLAGISGELIVSTNRALYRIVEGDAVLLLTQWGAPSDTNGKYMHNFQGNVYITLGESLLRFDGENFLPFGPDLGEGLPLLYAGDIAGLASNNNWLLCAVNGEVGSVWGHNGQGWHFITEMPTSVGITAIGYTHEDKGFATFLICGDNGLFYRTHVADTKKAQRRAAEATAEDYIYHHFSGWLETDWFYGGLREVQKDWESVYIDGENLSSSAYVEIYWKVEDTDDWSLLGTVTEPTQELRWSDYETRPESRRIKIGVALYNSLGAVTPVVTAIRVKYMPMITDRWRWQFPVAVHNNAETPDGDVSPYNTAVMLAHLDALIKQVPPFIFIDEDAIQYEVKIMSGNRRSVKVEYDAPSETLERQWVYDLVLEQVTADAYTP